MQALVAQRLRGVRLAQRFDQRVRPSARGVLLLPRGHVGRTHHALPGLATRADALAAVGGGVHPALAEVQVRDQRLRTRRGGVPQVLRHRRRVHHHARVEPVLRVEDRLDLAHRAVELGAEDGLVELRPDAPVAVLARVHAVELGDQVLDLLRDGAERVDLLGEVDERPDVQAADGAVPVEAGLEPVPIQDGGEPLHVRAEPLRRDRRVLHERGRSLAPFRSGHQQAEPGLAHFRERVLLGRGLGAQHVVAVAVLVPRRGERVQLRAHLVRRVAGERDEQQRARVAFQAIPELAELELGPRQGQDRAVDHLDRPRLQVERILRGRDGVRHRLEVSD